MVNQNQGEELLARISNDIELELKESLSDVETMGFEEKNLMNEVTVKIYEKVLGDLYALVAKDPAARGMLGYAYATYSSFKAVMAYRIANALYYFIKDNEDPRKDLLIFVARSISEKAKVEYGIEIHPAAIIGDRFVIDHGTGMVIGETTIIGQDCYLLQGVVLGARGIAKNPPAKRHPTLGNRVEVAAFVRILGPVEVGDDVHIGANCIITKNVPNGIRVSMIAQCQFEFQKEENLPKETSQLEIFGVVPRQDILVIYGESLNNIEPVLVDKEYNEVSGVKFKITDSSTSMELHVKLESKKEEFKLEEIHQYHLGLYRNGKLISVIVSAKGLQKFFCGN